MTGLLDKCKDHGAFKCKVESCFFYEDSIDKQPTRDAEDDRRRGLKEDVKCHG